MPSDADERFRQIIVASSGTADDNYRERRGWLMIDWVARDYTSAWVSLSHEGLAGQLRALPEISDMAGRGM